MGFCRQEYWSGLPFPTPGDLPDPGIEPTSPASAGGFFTTEPSLSGYFPLLCLADAQYSIVIDSIFYLCVCARVRVCVRVCVCVCVCVLGPASAGTILCSFYRKTRVLLKLGQGVVLP